MSRRPTGTRLLLAVALSVVAALSGCDDEPASPPVAWLVDFGGPVRIDRADSAEGGSKDAPLYDGNVISTGAAAKATVRYSDRTQVSVGENTRFKIGSSNGQLTLELEAGTILSSSRSSGAGGLTIVTKYGRMQMLEGSEISFALGTGGESSMEVLSGSIELISADGSKTTVLEGEEMDLALGTKTATAGTPDAGAPVVEAPAEPEPLPVQWVFAAPRGKATLKGKGEKRFTAATARETPVAPGTQFTVGKSSSGVLRGKGLSSRLAQLSTGTIGDARQVGDAEQYAISLEGGAAELEFAHQGTRSVDLQSRGRQAKLESSDVGSVGVSVGKSGMEFVVRAGEVKLTAGGETRALSTGDRVELVGNVLKPTRKLQAGLALPHSRKVRVYANRLETVALSLPEHAEPIRVEVARDSEFSDRVLNGMVAGASVVVAAPASGELFWRALNGEEKELAKGHARFFPDKGSDIDLDNPHAEVAETGLKASVLFQSVAPAITFSFAPKDGAAGYRVRVFKTGDLKKPLVEKVVKEPRCAFEAGQIPEGEYLWNAAPLAASGGELSGGRMNRLELTYDNSRTTLAIARPRLNDVVSASARSTQVQGVAPIGSKLFVNGKPVTLGPKGRFELQVPRTEQLVFRLVSDSGEGYWVRPLRRRP